jgi:hypothetical protein
VSALAATLYMTAVVRGFGFPDGHVTDLERVYARHAILFLPAVGVLGLILLALAHLGGRRRVGAWIGCTVVALAILALAAWFVGADLASTLDDGAGG